MTAGRTVPRVTYTLANGAVVELRPVSPWFANHVRKCMPPKPQPPMVEVNGALEPHTGDPDYLAALNDYEAQINQQVMDAILLRGVVLEIGEAERAELAELRETLEIMGAPMPDGDEKLVYLKYIALSADDLPQLIKLIRGESQPTEEAVARHEAEFRNNGQRRDPEPDTATA